MTDLGQCGSLLMDTVGYYHLADNTGVAAETSRLNYAPHPNSINEIGGFLWNQVYLLASINLNDNLNKYKYVLLPSQNFSIFDIDI
jgi:hypothetical protein